MMLFLMLEQLLYDNTPQLAPKINNLIIVELAIYALDLSLT